MADFHAVTQAPSVTHPPTHGVCVRYSLFAFAMTAIECVAAMGGLRFDATRAGWDVTAYIRESDDDRPLRILGAGSADLLSAAAAVEMPNHPRVLAFSGGLYLEDKRIRNFVEKVLRLRSDDVIVWGDCPRSAHGRVGVCRRQHACADTSSHQVPSVTVNDAVGVLHAPVPEKPSHVNQSQTAH